MKNVVGKRKILSPSWAEPDRKPGLIHEVYPARSDFSSVHQCKVGPSTYAAHRSVVALSARALHRHCCALSHRSHRP
jgi:hypothetical protein